MPLTQFIVTTKLDDNDDLFSGFTQYIYEHISKFKLNDKLPR